MLPPNSAGRGDGREERHGGDEGPLPSDVLLPLLGERKREGGRSGAVRGRGGEDGLMEEEKG